MTSYVKLVREVLRLLDKFDPESQCVETFLGDASKTLQNVDVSEEMFVLDVFSGCIEYKKLLDIVVDAFYVRCGKNILHSQRNLFAVICYLATFLLEELGLQNFSKIVKSQDVNKMHKFLGFFFDVTNLNTWIKDEWIQIYDAPYVENNWIAPLLRWQPEMEVLTAQLSNRVALGSSPKRTAQKQTQPREFNLTKPKPRAVPLPDKIPLQEKLQPVPASTYRPPKEKQLLDEVKLKNRQKAETVLLEANTGQLRCANPEKSGHTKQVVSQIIEEREAMLKFDAKYSSGIPATSTTDHVPIRLNNTTILREGALYSRKVEEELRRMEQLTEGAGDSGRFLRWQQEMRERDLQQELAELERRRLAGRISHEEAVLARHRIMQRNQARAHLKKQETAELMRRYAEQRLEEEKEMRELVEQVVEGHKNTKVAKMRLQEYKQRIVQEVSEQSHEMLRQALEEAQAELSRKFELIREIRALEAVPPIRHKFVDLTETGGYALLGEMSLLELRERLARLREAEQQEEEERRDKILEEKRTKEQLLLDQLDHIALHRAALARAATLRKEKKAKSLAQKGTIKDERVVELQRKLEEKRQERRRQEESLKMKTGKGTAQSHRPWKDRKQSLEEVDWTELERSLERQVLLTQPGPVSRETELRLASYQAQRIGPPLPASLARSVGSHNAPPHSH
ncbi:cilia- and flagella-associated protein 99 [Amia ocellicauda]|uniref:cilia- and flagella-associated protein 99 n=1 Tax=Amia ocellicauda TaxID=2972642 RepID=UPI003464AFBE